MNLAQRVKNGLQAFSAPEKNSMGANLGKQFLRHGSNKPLVQGWSEVLMSDRDLYTGYSYAAINNRANAVAQLATNNLKTDATPDVLKAFKKKAEEVQHPYFAKIEESEDFDDYSFWKNISIYLDWGVYYLMVVRAVSPNKVGDIQYFKMLNPFEVIRVRNKETGQIGGYVERHDGMEREIPPQMIIDMRELNPFNWDEPYGMTHAMKDSQFTMKSAGDYTRHSINNNINSPGAISTDVLLDPQNFENFKARIVNHEKGEPIFGNGSGAINWQDMQIDLNNAALDKVNDISLNAISAVSGNSKTMLGIEQSGVTRDTAKVQKDLFIANHGIPRLQLIIASFNQDYKKYYKEDYQKNKYRIFIDSPLGVDREAEKLDVEIRDSSYTLYSTLVNKGYTEELAAKYAAGEISLEELGKPTNEPVQPVAVVTPAVPAPDAAPAKEEPVAPKTNAIQNEVHTHEVPAAIHNALDEDAQRNLNTQEGMLKNRIVNIQESLVSAVLNKVTTNAFDEQSDIVSAEAKNEAEKDLEAALALFYGIVVPLYASSVMRRRTSEFQLAGSFSLDKEAKEFIKANAKKGANSHVDTILDDLLEAVRFSSLTDGGLGELPAIIQSKYPEVTVEEVRASLKEVAKGVDKSQKEIASLLKEKYEKNGEAELFKGVQSAALDGASQQQLVSSIRKEYTSISTNRAKLIAHTETNRAFTHAQLDADRQFLAQNNLTHRAYKKLINRSSNPCIFCKSMAAKPPIPFDQNFVDLGGDVTAIYQKEDGTTSVRKLPINYEAVEAGNLHAGCFCGYILIIE